MFSPASTFPVPPGLYSLIPYSQHSLRISLSFLGELHARDLCVLGTETSSNFQESSLWQDSVRVSSSSLPLFPAKPAMSVLWREFLLPAAILPDWFLQAVCLYDSSFHYYLPDRWFLKALDQKLPMETSSRLWLCPVRWTHFWEIQICINSKAISIFSWLLAFLWDL